MLGLTVLDVCVCHPDSKIKYSVYVYLFYVFCWQAVGYCTGIFYAFIRQISMLCIDNKDSVFCKYKVHKDGEEKKKKKRSGTSVEECNQV